MALRLANQHVARIARVLDNASEAALGWDHLETSVDDGVI